MTDPEAASIQIQMTARSKVHTLANDCELHMAGQPSSVTVGSAASVVVEPPNIRKQVPAGIKRSPATYWPAFVRDGYGRGLPRGR